MKWIFYVIVFVYMFYRAVYGIKLVEHGVIVEPVTYGEDGFLKVGEHKTISCKAANRNQKVEWLYPNGSVVKRNPSSRIFSQEHFVQSLRGRTPALVLTITKSLVKDTGIYQCRSGDQTKDVPLCVIEPSEFVETTPEVTADIGRSITLSCQAKGDPEPRIVWNRNGETITDEDSSAKYRVMTKYNIQGFEGLLTITSLEPSDSGVYSCVSLQDSVQNEDCSYSKMHNITLNVNYAPTFEAGNETIIYGKNNQQLDIQCSAQGFPAPTYRVFKELPDESLFEFDQKQIEIAEEENTATITVVASAATFGQRYKCLATNNLGSSEQYITLLKMEKPRRIGKVETTDVSDKAAQFNVTWYDDVMFPVSAFDIQYFVDSTEGTRTPKEPLWRKSSQVKVKVEDDATLRDFGALTVTLPDLEKENSYWVRLRATNEAGESAWSEPVLVATTAEEETEVDDSESESTEVPAEAEPSVKEVEASDATFYGIFFAGGIFVVAFVCMFAMRMVK